MIYLATDFDDTLNNKWINESLIDISQRHQERHFPESTK